MSEEIGIVGEGKYIVEPEEEFGEMSPSGLLHVPETARGKAVRGKIIAVGVPQYNPYHPNILKPNLYTIGDTVLFGKYSGVTIELDGGKRKLLVLNEHDILASLTTIH